MAIGYRVEIKFKTNYVVAVNDIISERKIK